VRMPAKSGRFPKLGAESRQGSGAFRMYGFYKILDGTASIFCGFLRPPVQVLDILCEK
jgi:hypothetical protein